MEINLKKYYPELYQTDEKLEVPDEIVALLDEADRSERANIRRVYWHHAQYSLDRNDGIEHDALHKPLPPWDAVEAQLTQAELFDALLQLPDKQLRRLYAHYFLGRGVKRIARLEGVHHSSVTKSIKKALCNLLNFVRTPF